MQLPPTVREDACGLHFAQTHVHGAVLSLGSFAACPRSESTDSARAPLCPVHAGSHFHATVPCTTLACMTTAITGKSDGKPHSTTEKLSGVIERVTFHSEESGFCVLQVKVKGHRDPMTVIGTLPQVRAGEWIEAEGRLTVDRDHGQQCKAGVLRTTAPATAIHLQSCQLLATWAPHRSPRPYAVGTFSRL